MTRKEKKYVREMPSREYYFFIDYLLRPDTEYDENGEDCKEIEWFRKVNSTYYKEF